MINKHYLNDADVGAYGLTIAGMRLSLYHQGENVATIALNPGQAEHFARFISIVRNQLKKEPVSIEDKEIADAVRKIEESGVDEISIGYRGWSVLGSKPDKYLPLSVKNAGL